MVSKTKFKIDNRDENISHNALAKILQRQLMRTIRSDPTQVPLPQTQQPGETFDFNFNVPKNDMSQISSLTKTLQNNVLANNVGELNNNLNNVESEYAKLENNGQYDRIKRNIELVDNLGDVSRNDNVKNILQDHTRKMKGKYLYLSKDSHIYKIMELMKSISETAKSEFNENEIINKFSELTIEIKYYLKSEKNYTDLREALFLFVDELKTKYENNTQKKIVIENLNKLLENVKYIYNAKVNEYAEILKQIKEIRESSVYNPSHYNPSLFSDDEDESNHDGEQFDVEFVDDTKQKHNNNNNNNNNNINKNINRPEDIPIEKKIVMNAVKIWESKNEQDIEKKVDMLFDNEELILDTNPKVFKEIYIKIYGDKKVAEFVKYINDLVKILFSVNYKNYNKTGNLPYIANYVNYEYEHKQIEEPPTHYNTYTVTEPEEEEKQIWHKQIEAPPTQNKITPKHDTEQEEEEKQTAADPELKPVYIMAKNTHVNTKQKSFTIDMMKKEVDERQFIFSKLFFDNIYAGKNKINAKLSDMLEKLDMKGSFSFQNIKTNDDAEIENMSKIYSEPGSKRTRNAVLINFIRNTRVFLVPYVDKELWETQNQNLHTFIKNIYNNDNIVKYVMAYYDKKFTQHVGFKD